MPSWRDNFSNAQIRNIALFILETRADVNYETSNFEMPLTIPVGTIETELHNFRLETVVSNLNPLPFSIEPLPDGRLLLTEKTKGVSIISRDGEHAELITGKPRAYDDFDRLDTSLGIEKGMGRVLYLLSEPKFWENG